VRETERQELKREREELKREGGMREVAHLKDGAERIQAVGGSQDLVEAEHNQRSKGEYLH
jgi:hypothetical protein